MTAAALPRRLATPLAGQRQTALARARQRLMTAMLLFFLVIGAIGLRLVDLALLSDRPSGTRNPYALLTPPRGDIFDRNGVELARTFDAVAITVSPRKLVGDPNSLAQALAAILTDRTPEQIRTELVHPGSFRYLARRVLPAQAKRINDLGEPAIRLEREPERLYPNLELASHVLGFVAADGRGKYGIELARNALLSDEKTRGKPLFLSIDSRVQQALENELGFAMDKHTAAGAAGVVLDVRTGEVIALASLPSFNPNAAGTYGDEAMRNRVTNGVYELGSTFKTLTIAMSLDAGLIRSMAQKYDATNPIHIGGFTINDDRGHRLRRWATIPEIFTHSSNIATAHMAAELGATRQRAYLDRLGFLAPVSGELLERGNTLYPSVSNWGEIATMTVGYGHGIAVTPLHLATAYAAAVNGGIWRPATMLKVEPGHEIAGNQVFSAKTSDTMRALLRMVVTSGTGRRANAPGYRVGGKTGTAEKLQAGGGGYNRRVNVSTFAAAFPMDAPRYVVIALLDAPHGTADTGGYSTAGMVSAPIVAKTITRIGPILGITPDPGRDIDVNAVLGLIPETVDE